MKKKAIRTLVATAVTAAVCLLSNVSAVYADTNAPTCEKHHGLNYLQLVNKTHKLPDDWESTVTLVKTKDANGNDEFVEEEALKQFRKLQKDVLENDGVQIELDSVYRSVADQQELWDRWTIEKGIDYVKTYVAVPGTSEHHTGLAIDVCLIKDGKIIDENEDMIADTESFAKVHAKLADYGFILRFPEGKKDITGYEYEPWHFRYVDSTAVAHEVMDNDLTFEEYITKVRYKGMPKSPDWVVRLGEEKNASQLVIIAGISEDTTTATIQMHEKTPSGTWRQVVTTPGFIGKKGLGKTKEGDYKTPVGTFHFTRAFGIADDPGAPISLKYKKAGKSTYWSADPNCLYNQMVDIRQHPELDAPECEHIIDYKSEYQYCLNISYNEEGTPGVGNAIFFHCTGYYKPYTGGCVAIPQSKMETVMKYVRSDCVVVIDSLANISPELKEEWNV